MMFGKIIYRLKKYAKIYWLLLKDPRTPKISKVMVFSAIIYLIWPFDLIPDVIPFAGIVDELIIIPLLFYFATRFIPKHVVEDNKKRAKGHKKEFENAEEGTIIED